tara:strand:+ start:6462 stop:6743 length:282 start_codon:yes stop_codon:yes gene_type:complete
MFESLISNSAMLIGGGSAGVILWALKKVPNKDICMYVEGFFYGLGRGMTLGLGKWKVTKDFWNRTIEPWFIDLVDNVIGGAVRGFIRGLRTDR